MMKKELQYLPVLLKAHFNQETVILKSDIDYSALYQIAHSHNLSAIVFCVINTSKNKDLVPKAAFRKFQDDFFEAVMRYDIQQSVLEETDTLLGGGKIRHVFFKGAEIKEYYPAPQARIMGDIDILIAEDDRGLVKDRLTANGFQLVHSNGPVYDYAKDGVKLEVHTKIISGRVGNADAEEGFRNAIHHAAFDGFRGSLNPEYHFAYLIAHIAHHFWFYGAGIKLVLDLAVFQKQFALDYASVFATLEKTGLSDFAKVILSVCFKWFGVGKDFGLPTEETEKFLLSFGAFGNANRNRASVVERKELEEGKSTSPVTTRLRLLFPPYSKLKSIPYIHFIEGRPYLLPFAWIYRICYNFKNKRSFVLDTAKNIGSDETKSDARKEFAYFKEIGLL